MKELDVVYEYGIAVALLIIGFLVFRSKIFSYLYAEKLERLIISKIKRNVSNLILSVLLFLSISLVLFAFSVFEMNLILINILAVIVVIVSLLWLFYLWLSYYKKQLQTKLRNKLLNAKSYLFSIMILSAIYIAGLRISTIDNIDKTVLGLEEDVVIFLVKLIASFAVGFVILILFKLVVFITRFYEESVCIEVDAVLYEVMEIVNSEKVVLKKFDEKIYRIIDVDEFYEHELVKMFPVNTYRLF